MKSILFSLLNPEEVTVKAFQTQEKFLKNMADQKTEDELFEILKGRLGPGLGRALAAKAKGR